MSEKNDDLLGDFFKLIGEAKKTEVKPVAVPLPPPPPAHTIKQLEEKIEADLVGKVSAEVSFLSDLFKVVSEAKQEVEKKKVEEEKIQPLLGELESVFTNPSAFKAKKRKAIIKKEEKQVTEETLDNVIDDLPKEVSSKIVPENPPKPVPSVDLEEIEDKFRDIVKRLQDEITTLKKSVLNSQRTGWGGSSGGGEVNLRYLDDIDRASIQDGRILSYDASIKKFKFIPKPTGGGGTSNTIIERIPLSGKSISINLADYAFTDVYSLEAVDADGNEVSIVIKKINQLNIQILSTVDLTGLFLIAIGV